MAVAAAPVVMMHSVSRRETFPALVVSKVIRVPLPPLGSMSLEDTMASNWIQLKSDVVVRNSNVESPQKYWSFQCRFHWPSHWRLQPGWPSLYHAVPSLSRQHASPEEPVILVSILRVLPTVVQLEAPFKLWHRNAERIDIGLKRVVFGYDSLVL